ncbi:hypothetical protein SLUN_31725 [Streptomyces lunaelactis]|uniref:Uncharacterized protein n=1 Tax=Streptomyces lunaelactis TaxID=1535768 RepID=A0A2R4TAE5_9ACTN|nr:hypothetical protein [Streptomyces lunaelactis]AVZ76093.1 hypothetical protein SLUN_31725 [Streptomyces lunaelactis]NUK83720.1 hypothetical protein [Streptomyces lunaelactis]
MTAPNTPLQFAVSAVPVAVVLMSVALYGDTALRRHVAHFARDGGLLGRGSRDTGFHVHHDATGGGASCGA